MNSLPPHQRTMTTQDVLGMKIEAIPGMAVCDFCTDAPVVAAYPCGLVVMPTPAGTHISSDPWGACAECHALIAADDREGLVERSLRNFVAENGPVPPEIGAMFADVHNRFFAARLGEPHIQ